MQDFELLRYSRQIMLKQTGIEAQQKLLNSRVLIAGVGGLGCSSALYLAGSGIGSMMLVDYDLIELSNLPRQVLFDDRDIGQSKSEMAAKKLSQQFAELEFNYHHGYLSDDLVSYFQPDLIIDAGDNLVLTHLISDIASELDIDVVHASVSRVEGHIYSYLPQLSFPSLREVFPLPAETETCSQVGVMTAAVGLIASYQAMQAVRILLAPNLGEITPEIALFDGLSMRFMAVKI